MTTNTKQKWTIDILRRVLKLHDEKRTYAEIVEDMQLQCVVETLARKVRLVRKIGLEAAAEHTLWNAKKPAQREPRMQRFMPRVDDGASLWTEPRAGSLAFLACPTRRGARLYYRDGRVEPA